MLLIPCRQANRRFERSSKNKRPDKHSQNDRKHPETAARKQAKTPKTQRKEAQNDKAQTRPQTGQRDLSYGVQSVGSCDQPSGAPHYVIPVTLQIQTRLESPKNKAQKTAKLKKESQRKATKSGQNRQKNAPKRKQTKSPPNKETDRIASSKSRKIPSCKLLFRPQ